MDVAPSIMEHTESRTRERRNQEREDKVLMNNKPLHRFINKEPRVFGIVVLMFGCAEVMMGFVFSNEELQNAHKYYLPFWQGALFLVSGIAAINAELHPSKKLVTVCLALNVVSILGIVISCSIRIDSFFRKIHRCRWIETIETCHAVMVLLLCPECVLFVSSMCVFGLLVFMCIFARFALKSTKTQVIVQQIPLPETNTAAN